MISWPSQLPQNEVRDQWAIASDWYPTILELCDLPKGTHEIDGQSLLPIIQSENAEAIWDEWHWDFNKYWSIRKGDWKLLYDPQDTSLKRKPDPNKSEDIYYLVNLKDDIGERNNLAAQYPEKVKELKQLYEKRSRVIN